MNKKIICRVLLCLMILALMPVQAHAIDRVDLSKSVNLTIQFSHEGQPLHGAQLKIYKVAEMDEWGEFTFLDEFASYPVMLPVDTDWTALANTLDAYIQQDQLDPADAGITDENGMVKFPKKRMALTPGLYLITGSTLTYNGVCYTPAPTLVALPNRAPEEHQWDYDVEAQVKYTRRTAPADYTVMKVWKDDGNESKRPASIKVNLLRDGSVHETVILSADNQWQHTWCELEAGYTWTVTEEAVKDYSVLITQGPASADLKQDTVSAGHILFTVTNTCTASDENGLPQTGSLWWPVPVLMIMGLICLIVGLFKMRRLGNEG